MHLSQNCGTWCIISMHIYSLSIYLCVALLFCRNGIIFRATGPLCGEFTGHQWIPHTKASDADNGQWRKQSWGWWFETPWRSLWRHYDVICCTYKSLKVCLSSPQWKATHILDMFYLYLKSNMLSGGEIQLINAWQCARLYSPLP